MDKIVIIEILDIEKYKYNPFVKKYGILQDTLYETAVINWESNRGGICTNISHKDYKILPDFMWDIVNGEVIVLCCDVHICTGLKIWGIK